MHPFPAEHDQQQAHALDILREAKEFILIHFPKREKECDHPLCMLLHSHRATSIIASCSNGDLHRAVEALGEEIMLTSSINALMSLSTTQREQVAAMLLGKGEEAFFRLFDDEDQD